MAPPKPIATTRRLLSAVKRSFLSHRRLALLGGAAALFVVGALAGAVLARDDGDGSGGTAARPSGADGGHRDSPSTTRPRGAPGTYGLHSIGFIGCSNSWMTVQGYQETPGNEGRLWDPYGTGSKTIGRWADAGDPIWDAFDKKVEEFGQPVAVWVQMCEDERQPATFDDVAEMLANLADHVTTRTFYISPLNSFSPELLCDRMGPDGIEDLIQFADEATDEGLAERGPDVGPLSATTTRPDHCHPNDEGRLLVGGQLAEFIDDL